MIYYHIDSPNLKTKRLNGPIEISGWAFSEKYEKVNVEAVFNKNKHVKIELNKKRIDVVEALKQKGVQVTEPTVGFQYVVDNKEITIIKKLSIKFILSDNEHRVDTEIINHDLDNEPIFNRAQYKEVWNLESVDLTQAENAVAGYTSLDQRWKGSSSKFVERILKPTVGVNKDDTILEIGAGVGRVGNILAPMCKKWIGADVSSNMLGHLQKKLSKYRNVETFELSGYDLRGIESGSMDLIYSTIVFMHLDEWERYSYCRDSFRCLKEGGRIYIDNFNLMDNQGWDFFLENAAYHPLLRPANISKSSTPQELETYLVRAGFSDVKIGFYKMWVYGCGIKKSEP